MKKILYILLIFLALISFLILINNNKNWEFFVEHNIGSKSTYQDGNNLFFDEKKLYFSDQENTIYALNKNNGKLVWKFNNHGYSPFRINILENKLYLANFDSHIYSIDKKNGYPTWSYSIGSRVTPDTEVVSDINDNEVFFADRSGILYALNKNNGKVIWSKQYKAPDKQKSFINGSIHFGFIEQTDDLLFIRNYPQNEFSIIRKSNGEDLYKITDFIPNTKEIINLENILIIPKSDYQYIAINKNNFTVVWTEGDSLIKDPIKIYKDENDPNNLLLQNNRYISKINKDSGKMIWNQNVQLNAKILTVNSSKDIIVTEEENSSLFNFNLKLFSWSSGNLKSQISIPSAVQKIIIKDQNIIVGTITDDVYFININSNEIIKRLKTEGYVLEMLPFENNLVLITSDSGKKAVIYNLDTNIKEFIWIFKSDTTIYPKEIYKDNNRLYFINDKKFIIQSIKVDNKEPKFIKKINFNFIENFSKEKPKVEYLIKNNLIVNLLKKKLQKNIYILKNIFNIFKFEIDQTINNKNEVEITIRHDQNLYNNYYTDLIIDCVFTDQNNNSVKAKAYYYDYNTWKINFVNNENKLWKWKMTIKTPLHKTIKQGEVNTEFNINLDKVTVKDNSVVLNDSKIFFPIGFQDAIIDKNFDGNPFDQMGYAKNNEPAIKESDFDYISFQEYLDLYRKDSKLNIYRINIDNWGPSLLSDLDPVNFSVSTNDAQNIDFMIKELKTRNFKIIMTIFGFYPPYQDSNKFANKQNREALKKYLDYVIYRYSPFIDIWEISNEASIPEVWQNFISDYIKKNDIYNHPITINWEQQQLKNSDLLSVHWYSQIPKDNAALERQMDFLNNKYNDWKGGIMFTETGYKMSSFFENSSELMRIFTWLSTFNKIGVVYWNNPVGINNNPDNANIYLGPIERVYLNNLNNFLPEMDVPVYKNKQNYSTEGISLYSMSNNKYLLGYLINQKDKTQNNVTIALEAKNAGSLEWFNPKNGNNMGNIEIIKGINKIIIPEISQDLAFKISYLNN